MVGGHRSLLLALTATAIACGAPPPGHTPPSAIPSDPDLAIEIEKGSDRLEGTLDVTERFRAGPDGLTRVELPSHFAGQRGFELGISDVRAESAGGATLRRDSATTYTVVASAGSRIALEYRVHETKTSGGRERERRFRPFIQRDYFFFFGEAVFATVQGDDAQLKAIEIKWRGFPEQYAVANSFGVNERTQRFRAKGGAVRRGVYLGGDFRVRRVGVRGRPLMVATRGALPFSDESIDSIAARVVSAERTFWKDEDFPYFLIAILESATTAGELSGTSGENAFSAFVSTRGHSEQVTESRLGHLFAHEMFHTWNGQRIEFVGEPEGFAYWFSEGFTEYYANIIELRTGLVDMYAYIERTNQLIRSYLRSSALHLSNGEAARRFWNDPAAHELPYQRGALLAARWNDRIKKTSNGTRSLDDVMRDLLAVSRSAGGKITLETFVTVMGRYLADDPSPDLARYIDAGEVLGVTEGEFGPCSALEMKKESPYDLGFDHVRGSGNIQGVRLDGPAYRAGLRDGMRYRSGSWTPGRSDVPVNLVIREDGGGERTVSYLPAGNSVDMPQFRVVAAEFAENPERCMAWFNAN